MSENSNITFKLHVIDEGGGTYGVRQASLKHGKFYDAPHKSDEISPSEVDKIDFTHENPRGVHACGRLDAAVGTEGEFKIRRSDKDVVTVKWMIPYAFWSLRGHPCSDTKPVISIENDQPHDYTLEVEDAKPQKAPDGYDPETGKAEYSDKWLVDYAVTIKVNRKS